MARGMYACRRLGWPRARNNGAAKLSGRTCVFVADLFCSGRCFRACWLLEVLQGVAYMRVADCIVSYLPRTRSCGLVVEAGVGFLCRFSATTAEGTKQRLGVHTVQPTANNATISHQQGYRRLEPTPVTTMLVGRRNSHAPSSPFTPVTQTKQETTAYGNTSPPSPLSSPMATKTPQPQTCMDTTEVLPDKVASPAAPGGRFPLSPKLTRFARASVWSGVSPLLLRMEASCSRLPASR